MLSLNSSQLYSYRHKNPKNNVFLCDFSLFWGKRIASKHLPILFRDKALPKFCSDIKITAGM